MQKCEKSAKYPIGYKQIHLATFKHKYPTIPELMLHKYKVALDTNILVFGMFYLGGYRTPFRLLFKGSLSEWFKKYFVRYYEYDSNFYYKRKRGSNKTYGLVSNLNKLINVDDTNIFL